MLNTNFKTKYGPWALVTGASSGIGKEFAKLLAKAGLNVVLLARRKHLLETLATELSEQYSIETKIIDIDLTNDDCMGKIESLTNELDIGLLINNAGAGFPGAYLKGTLESRTQVIKLNIMMPAQLTYLFGNKMREKKRGGIIMVSSVGARLAAPYLANYSATKAFLLSLGESLNIELEKDNIDVTVLMPGATKTEMAEKEGADFSHVPDAMWSSAEYMASAGLTALGNKAVVTPGALNKISLFIMTNLLPRKLAATIFGDTIKKAIHEKLI